MVDAQHAGIAEVVAEDLDEVRVALRIGGFGIHTRLDRPLRSVLHVGVHLVAGDQLVDREIIADERALEAPLLLQHLTQQPWVGMRRNAVDLVVRRHDAHDPGVDGGLETGQEILAQRPF